MIPKIIHQTWKDKNLPNILQAIVDENKKLLTEKGYEFMLWSDDEIIELIKSEYPHLLNVYESTCKGVQKGDIARIILVHHFGGIYIDLDILIMNDPEDIMDFSKDKLYITYEPAAQTIKLYGNDDYICNAFFAANKNNNILNFAIQNMNAIFQRNGANIFMKFDIFGGSYFKSIIYAYTHYNHEVNIITNRELIFPINDLKFDNLPSSKGDWDMVKYNSYPPNTIMVHYWIHGDFESQNLLKTFKCDTSLDIHHNVYKFFSILYPNIAKMMLS